MKQEEKHQDFTSYLESLQDSQRMCHIKFRSVEGGVSVLQAHIVKLTSEADRQIIETDAGFSIGVDQLLEVNGRSPGNIC